MGLGPSITLVPSDVLTFEVFLTNLTLKCNIQAFWLFLVHLMQLKLGQALFGKLSSRFLAATVLRPRARSIDFVFFRSVWAFW